MINYDESDMYHNYSYDVIYDEEDDRVAADRYSINYACGDSSLSAKINSSFYYDNRNRLSEVTVDAESDATVSYTYDNYDRLSSYAPIIVSYDKGQRQLSALIAEMFESRFANVRLTKTLPVSSRIFQVADFVCTLKRLVYKLEGEGTLSKSENIFFGTKSNFLKNWVVPVRRHEWI